MFVKNPTAVNVVILGYLKYWYLYIVCVGCVKVEQYKYTC